VLSNNWQWNFLISSSEQLAVRFFSLQIRRLLKF
jgi:hypothetical protein